MHTNNNIRNNNAAILRLLPDTIIRFGWTRGDSNPADLTSKLFLTPSAIINSSFYPNGPVDYLSEDPYGHVFLTINRDGKNYNPPPSELGVVSVDQCSVCKFPESCLVFLANILRRIQPDRACKNRGNKLQGQAGTADGTNKMKDMATVDKAAADEGGYLGKGHP